MFVNKTMKEDKMEDIHLIFKFLWYSILFCIWGVSCTSSGTYKKTQMDIYMLIIVMVKLQMKLN